MRVWLMSSSSPVLTRRSVYIGDGDLVTDRVVSMSFLNDLLSSDWFPFRV